MYSGVDAPTDGKGPSPTIYTEHYFDAQCSVYLSLTT